MKYRKQSCPWCEHEAKPLLATAGRVKHKGHTLICEACHGIVG